MGTMGIWWIDDQFMAPKVGCGTLLAVRSAFAFCSRHSATSPPRAVAPILVSRHGRRAHPCIMKMGYARWRSPLGQRRVALVLGKSVVSLTWELSAPRIVAFAHAEQS